MVDKVVEAEVETEVEEQTEPIVAKGRRKRRRKRKETGGMVMLEAEGVVAVAEGVGGKGTIGGKVEVAVVMI